MALLTISLLHACQKNDVQGLTTRNLTSPSCQLRSSNYIFDAGSKWIYQNDSTGELIQVKVRSTKRDQAPNQEHHESICFIQSQLSPADFSYSYSEGEFSNPPTDQESTSLPSYWERSGAQLNDTLFHPQYDQLLYQTPRLDRMKIRSLIFTEVDEVVQFASAKADLPVRRDFYSPRVGRIKWMEYEANGSITSYSLISYQTILWEM
ncbi:hypothetical protein KFE98_03665 [bacterium SCSIO 12741]|nr:hypothetical protein KFE98_03665 [bacterium SCSIO 12741]